MPEIWSAIERVPGANARSSCGRLAAESQRGGDLAPAVEAAQTDLAADDEPEEPHEGVPVKNSICVSRLNLPLRLHR